MKRWCWLLLLLCCTAWGHPLIRVGGYPYAPFVVKDDSGHYRGLTLDLIDQLNEIQQEVKFIFVPTSAANRYKALDLGRFSLMLFEDIRWDWNADQVRISRPLLLGGEHLVTLGAVRAAVKKYPDLHIVHFDAHADLRDDYLGAKLSHACVLRRCHELVGDGHIHQFCIRSGDRAEFEFAAQHTEMHKFDFTGLAELTEQLCESKVPVYLTIDTGHMGVAPLVAEVLARQHMEGLGERLEGAGVRVALVAFGPEGAGLSRLSPEAMLDHYDDLPALAADWLGQSRRQ